MCSVDTQRPPPVFQEDEGAILRAHWDWPWHHHHGLTQGLAERLQELSLAGLNYFNLFWYRMRYTHFVIHTGLQMPFYSQLNHKRALAFPSWDCPFGPNCMFLKNIQPPKSAMCKPKSVHLQVFIMGSPWCILFFQPMTHCNFPGFGLPTALRHPLENYSGFLF